MREVRITFSILALLFAGTVAAVADPEIFASASFESDSVGDHAKGLGGPEVDEEVHDIGDSGGVSAVEAATNGKRYRIGDVGLTDAQRGVELPFSSTVSTGTLRVQAVVSAAQTGNGGEITCAGPKEWEATLGRVSFGASGTFLVHGSATSVDYVVDREYLVEMVFHLTGQRSVDYSITDLSDDSVVCTVTGVSVSEAGAARAVLFTTDLDAGGEFTLDEVLVSR